MKYTFKFLLTNGSTVLLTFTASTYALARANADAYARTFFTPNELYDYYYAP